MCRELQQEKIRLEEEARSLRLDLSRMDSETAWAAGIFEGEGCLHCAKTGLCLRVSMCDEDIIRRWGEVMGAGKMRWDPPRGSGTKPQWSWTIHKRADIEAACFRLRPWLGVRRLQQFDAAFEKFWSTRPREPAAAPSAAPGAEEG